MAPVPAVSELDMSKVRLFLFLLLFPFRFFAQKRSAATELASLFFSSSSFASPLSLSQPLFHFSLSHSDGPRHHPRRRRRLPPLPPHQEARETGRASGRQLPPHRYPGLQLHQLGSEQGLHFNAIQLRVPQPPPGAGVQRQRGRLQVARFRGGACGVAVGGVQGEGRVIFFVFFPREVEEE